MSEGSSERSLCVATWGNPRAWRQAIYKVDGVGVRSFSTVHALKELEKPQDPALIFVVDSLAVEAGEGFSDYGGLERAVEGFVRSYLCGVEAELVVLPGVLRAERGGRRYSFKADLGDFRLLLAYALYRRALEVAGGGGVRIALDISHGVNYMPSLALEASQEAAAMVAAALARNVKLRVYQADPYPLFPQAEGLRRSSSDPCKPEDPSAAPPELGYGVMREYTLHPWDLTRYASYPQPKVKKVLTDPRYLGVDPKEAGQAVERAQDVLGAYRLGALVQLAVIVKTLDLKAFERVLEAAVQGWRSARTVSVSGGEVAVESRTRLSEGFRALMHAHAVVSGVRELIGGARCSSLSECTASYEELRKLKRLVEGSRVARRLVERELSKLEDLASKFEKEWKPYSAFTRPGEIITREDVERWIRERPDIFERDFIAHAGFHSDILYVRRVHDVVELKVDEKLWSYVANVLRSAVHA